MRHEFRGNSSRSKTDMKRSGGDNVEERLQSVSPYHSSEDLSALETNDASAEVVEKLESKVAAQREEGRKTVMLHCSRYLIDDVLQQNAATIAMKGAQWLTNAKSSLAEKANGIELATAITLCCGDDVVSMYDELGTTIAHWLCHPSAASQKPSILAAIMPCAALLLAANPQVCVDGEQALCDVLLSHVDWSRFEKNLEAMGSVLPALASVCSVTQRNTVKRLLEGYFERSRQVIASEYSAHAPFLASAVDAVGILCTRFPKTISWPEVEKYEVNQADRIVSVAMRQLQTLLDIDGSGEAEVGTPANSSTSVSPQPPSSPLTLESPESLASNVTGELPASPARGSVRRRERGQCEVVQFRERSVPVVGHHLCYLLRCLRQVVDDGILNHFARNATVRRIFGVHEDLVTRKTKAEVEQDKEDLKARLEEKEHNLRERKKDRQRKQQDRKCEQDE